MDNMNKNNEIVKLNEEFGITKDGVSLVTLSGRQISLQTLNGDISSIINFLQNNNENNNFEGEIKPNIKLLDERLKNFKLPVECKDKLKLIKTETIDDTDEQIIEYQSDGLNETTGEEYSLVDSGILAEKLQIDTEGASCSRNYNEPKTNELKVRDKKLEIEEKNLLPKLESSQLKTNPIKGKSLLNSSKNVVKSSTKGRSLLRTNRNLMKTLDNEIGTNKTICTKLKDSTCQTETRKIETIDALPIKSEIQETNKSGTAICAGATESSRQFKQIGKNANLIKLKYSLNSSTSRANTTVKLRSLLKSNRNITSSQIDKTNSKPEIYMETNNSDSIVSKPQEYTYQNESNQTDTTIDSKPTEPDLQIGINRPEIVMSEITESDEHIVRNTNPVKGKSLLNSSRNVVKSSKKCRSLLKANRNIKSSDNQSVTEKYKTTQTKSINQSETSQTYTTTNSKLIKSEIQFLKYNSNPSVDSKRIKLEMQIEPNDSDTTVSKPQEYTYQNESNQTDTTIDSKPTESELQNSINKFKTAMCTETTVSDVQTVRNTNLIKGKTLLNSNRNVVKSSMKLRSLLKPNTNILKSSDNHIDTKKSDRGRTKPVIQAVTKMNSKPIKSEIQIETYNSDSTVLSKPLEGTELSQTNTSIDSKRIKLEMQIEPNYSDTTVSKPQEYTYQNESNQTDTTIDSKPTESELQNAINKFKTATCTKTVSDVQIVRNTNPIKGKTLLNSSRNVVKSSMKLRSLIKPIANIMKSSDNHMDTKKSDTERTKSIVQYVTKMDSKPVKSEILMETYNSDTAVVSKPLDSTYQSEISKSDSSIDSKRLKLEIQIEPKDSDTPVVSKPFEFTYQNESNRTDTTINSKPTESELQNAMNKSKTAMCTETTVSDVQTVRNTNPIKGKTLLNSNRNVAKNSKNLRSLLKPNRSIVKTSDNQIDTKKSETERTESVYHSKTSQTDIIMDSKPMISEIQIITNNFDTTVVSKPLECIYQTEINQTDTTIDSKPIKLEIPIEKNDYGTIFSKPTEIMSQKMETNQTDIAIDLKPSESDLPIALNKSNGQIVKKSNPIKGKSLLNSRKNVIKNSIKLQSLLKPNRNIAQSLVRQIDTKKSDTNSTQLTESARQTETIHTGTALDSKPEIQMESTSAITTVGSKPSKILGEMESRQTYESMNSKPTKSNMQFETNKSNITECTKPTETDLVVEINKSDSVVFTNPVEVEMQIETSKSDSGVCTKPMEVEMQIETKKSNTALSMKLTESILQLETKKFDSADCTQPEEVEMQIETNNSDIAVSAKPVELDRQMELNRFDTTVCISPKEVDRQMELQKFDTAECEKTTELDLQIGKNKSDTVECTKTIDLELQVETKNAMCTKPTDSDLRMETNKPDTVVFTKPIESNLQIATNIPEIIVGIEPTGSDLLIAEYTKPLEVEMQKEKDASDNAECIKPTESELKIETNISDIALCTKPTESDIRIERNKSDYAVDIKARELEMHVETKKSDTTVCTKITEELDVDMKTNKSGTAVCCPKHTQLDILISQSATAECVKHVELDKQKKRNISNVAVCLRQTDFDIDKKTNKSVTTECTEPVEVVMQKETNKSDPMPCTEPVELDMEKKTNKSDITEFTKPEELNMREHTNRFDTIQCIKTVELNIQKEAIICSTTECTQPIELDMQKETNKSDTAGCTTPVEVEIQKETSKSDTAECTKPMYVDIQKESSKSDTAECTKPMELDILKETSKSDITEFTKPMYVDIQKESSKSDTAECTKPMELDIQNETSKSDITECTKPMDVDIQKESSKSDTAECTKPMELDIQKGTSKSDTTEFTKAMELDIQKETSKSDATECIKPVELDIQKVSNKSDTKECTKPVDIDLPKETNNFDTVVYSKLVDVNKSDTAMCTEVKVDMQKETKNSDAVIFKIPQVPVRKIIRKQNADIAVNTKSTVGRNLLNCADRKIFKKPKRPVNRTNIERKIWKDRASTKFANNQIVTDKSARKKFNQAINSKYSAYSFIKKRLLKRKELNSGRSVGTCSKKPKLTGSYSTIISTKSLECDNQNTSTSEICIKAISSVKDEYLLDCTSPVEECNDMPQFTETQINEQFLDQNNPQNMEINEISTGDNILWSSGDDLEIIKRSSETITVDSDTDSNYSVSSFYDEIVEQQLFIERPEGYPRIRVRSDLMPKSPNEVKQICGITLLYNTAQGRYVCAVVNVKEFKKKYGDRNLKLLLKKPNFRMDLHRVYRKISKMILEGTYTLDELKEYLIENLDKVMTGFEMYVSLKRKHKEFYESELEATKELAAELEIRRRIQKKKIERIKTVADIKKKSWCRVCLKEATIHCASAKYYCSVNCQNQDRISIVGTELSLSANMARTATKRKMEDREEVSPEKADNVRQSTNSGLKIAEVWSLNDQEEQEVVAASETGRIAVLKRRNYKNRTRKEMVNKVTRKRESRSKSNDVFSVETVATNVPATSYKDLPSLNIKHVGPSPNVNPLKKMRCDLKDISKLNTPNTKLNLGKINKVISRTEGTVNVPALIIDFPKNKPSNITTMNKTPQKLLLTNFQKQDGQLKNTSLRLFNFQTNSKVTMPNFILNNFKPQNEDINKNSQILHVAQPKSTSQHLQMRPNNQNQNLLMANMFKTGDTGLNKQFNSNKINTSVKNKNIPKKSLLLCKKSDMPSTSGIHRVVMAQDLEKPGPSGLNTKSARNTTNTVRYPTKPTSTPIKNPTKPTSTFIRKRTATPTISYPIKPISTPTIRYPTKPTSTPTIRYATTNITTKYPRKPTMNTQPILSLPTTTQPILQLPTNFATNIRMPRPIINSSVTSYNVTNPRKVLCNNNARPMRPRFLFPKPAKPDNLKGNQINSPPTVKTFIPTPNISQSQCINNNQTRINRATAPNIIANKVSDFPIRVSPSFSNAQSLPNLAKTLIVAKDNTYKLAVPSVRSDNISKPVYIIKDLPPKIEF